MTPQTELVLKQIIAQDNSIDPARIGRAFALLRSTSTYSARPSRIIRIPEVLKMLSISRPALYRYFDKGVLKRICGEGRNALGVTEESYIAFTNQRRKGS